ncbi:lysozyme family protein [Bacillus sp. FJAT-47783]|uniref:lysozyme family protein n=1 Tax=Bacillus sp. FJAT-47783 TaxID=2922712 RepID=UPI001FAB58FF|nr:lysozyme family protein [Bacillus sp. FJAT-47783]
MQFIFIFMIGAVLIGVGLIWAMNLNTSQTTVNETNYLEERLLNYEKAVHKELEEHNLVKLKPLLLAIMIQESNVMGNDIMQSSESAGLKRNEIKTPEKSIHQGVLHFAKMYEYGKQVGVDTDTIIQSYNMGPGYIDFVANNGKKHSEELAKQYSELKVEQNPDLYNCGGDKNNFRYPFCYGDFTYTTKVKDNLSLVVNLLEKQGEVVLLDDELNKALTRN